MSEAQPQLDIAEDINYSVSAASTAGGVRRGLDRCSDESEGVDRRRKSHTGMAKNRQPVVPGDEQRDVLVARNEQRYVLVPQRRPKSSLSMSSRKSVW